MIFKIFKLLLPALIPSWRFFDVIAASPRIQYRVFSNKKDKVIWEDYRPRPAYIAFLTMLKRLFWNPWWNDTLFLTACAERIMQQDCNHAVHTIATHILKDLEKADPQNMQFRLIYLYREGTTLKSEETYLSPVYDISTGNIT